jgi:membrane-bound metal-dependent hydrolase YbcI (DUF457 family)
MKRSGHFGVSAILSYPIFILISLYYSSNIGLIFFFLTIGLSKFPDIDNVFINQFTDKLGLLGYKFTITHRGITHTIYFSIFVGLSILALFIPVFLAFDFGIRILFIMFLIGFTSVLFHCIGDVFTPKGITYFPPITPNISFCMFWYNNVFANISTASIGFVCVVLSLLYHFHSYSVETAMILYFIIGLTTFLCLIIARSWNLRFSDIQ